MLRSTAATTAAEPPMDIETLQTRREASRRTLRARRRRAAAALVAVAVIVALLLVAFAGSSTSRHPAARHGIGASQAKHAGGTASAPATAKRGGGVRTGRPGQQPVPILMYHVIAPPPAGAPFPACTSPPANSPRRCRRSSVPAGTAVTLDQLAPTGATGSRCRPAGRSSITLRQRLPLAVLTGAAGAAQAWLGRRREHPADRPAAVAGRPAPTRGPRPHRRRAGSSTRRAPATPT